MRPVRQTLFGMGEGNCFAACVASILEMDVEDVPNFCHEEADADGSTWLERAAEWLKARGWGFIHAPWGTDALPYDCWVICLGMPRGRGRAESHAVIGRTICGVSTQGEQGGVPVRLWEWAVQMIHDPHPSDAFLDGNPTALIILVPSAA